MFRNLGIVISLLIPLCNAEYPSGVPHCKAEDNPCILKAANDIVKRFRTTGVPELTLPILDPYPVNDISVYQDSSQPINVKLQFKSANVYGLSEQVFERAEGFSKDPNKAKMALYGYIPKVGVTGKYSADGRILLLPITGDGNFILNATNVKGGLKMKTSVVEKDGLHYYKINKLKVLLEPETFEISLTNLFNGNKELSDSFLEVMRKNWREAWGEVSPPILDITESVVKKIMQALFDKFPHEELYLPD